MKENTMAHASMRRVARRFSGGVLTAALLAACGGGEIFAILQIVTPLAGGWSLEGGGGGSVSFIGAEDQDTLFRSTLAVSVNVLPAPPAVCGATNPLTGTLDNGKLTLLPNTTPASTTACITGVFTDLRRLELSVTGEAAKRVYLNDRVAVSLPVGVWSPESGTPTLKFTQPFSVDNGSTAGVVGCDVSNPAAKVSFTGTMAGFNTTTLAVPTAPALLGTAFTDLKFVDGATLTLRNANNALITLKRKPDPVQPDPQGTRCP
jgi:hypothetical protein